MALSGGQKQRVAIASAFAAGARILLFDEPTSGLDLAHMEKVGRLLTELANSGKTVLVSTHDPELIDQCCGYLLYIENGFALWADSYDNQSEADRAAHKAVPIQCALTLSGSLESVVITVNVRA